jgi:hypothetical protein
MTTTTTTFAANPTKRNADTIRSLTETAAKYGGRILRVWASHSHDARACGLRRAGISADNYLGGVGKRTDVSSRAYDATAWDGSKKTELGVFPSRGKAMNALIDERIRVNKEFEALMQEREEAARGATLAIRDRLRALTAECRDDMHEPDCQGVRVVKTKGTKLDNAYGASETFVGVTNTERRFLLRNDETGEEAWFNLADVIALARKAVI